MRDGSGIGLDQDPTDRCLHQAWIMVPMPVSVKISISNECGWRPSMRWARLSRAAFDRRDTGFELREFMPRSAAPLAIIDPPPDRYPSAEIEEDLSA